MKFIENFLVQRNPKNKFGVLRVFEKMMAFAAAHIEKFVDYLAIGWS